MDPGVELVLPIMWFDDEIKMAPDAKLPLMLGSALATPSAMVVANAVLSGGTLALQLALVLAYLGWKKGFHDDFHLKALEDEAEAAEAAAAVYDGEDGLVVGQPCHADM